MYTFVYIVYIMYTFNVYIKMYQKKLILNIRY